MSAPPPESHSRSSTRRSGSDRRERTDRRAEARFHGREDRRKRQGAPVKKERRTGTDRREASRRQGSRRSGKDRRHG
jgi:hypothetical protein